MGAKQRTYGQDERYIEDWSDDGSARGSLLCCVLKRRELQATTGGIQTFVTWLGSDVAEVCVHDIQGRKQLDRSLLTQRMTRDMYNTQF